MAAREHYSSLAAGEVTTTSSSSWASAGTLTFPAGNGKDYVLFWSLEAAQQSGTTSDAKFRVSLDGTPVAAANVESRATSEYPSYFGFFKITGAGADRTVAVEIQSETSGQTTAARNISLIALALGANDHYAENLSRVESTSTSFVTLVSDTWTPPGDERYLFLTSSLVDGYTNSIPGYGKLNIGWDSSEWPVSTPEIATGEKSVVPTGLAYIDTAIGTMTWLGRSGGSGVTGWASNRVLALRLADFEATYDTYTSADSTASSSSYSTALSLNATAAAHPHLIFATWAIGSTVSGVLGHVRVSDDGGAIAQSSQQTYSTTLNRGASSGVVALRSYAAGSQTWKLERASNGSSNYTLRSDATLAAFDLGPVSSGYTLTAAAGAFSLSGQAAATRATRQLPAAARSFALAGIANALRRGYRLGADARGYALAGQAAGIARGLRFAAAATSYALTGIAATLTRTVSGRTLTAAVGAFTLTAQTAVTRAGRRLTAASEGYTWARLAAILSWTRRMPADSGAYALTGRPIGWGWTHIMTPAPAGFATTGQAATLRYSGGQGWQPVPGTPETWNPKAGKSETWTPVSSTDEIWS